MVEKLATPTGRECYAQRKRLRPMVKEVLGFRRFSVRGPDKARGDLVCLARQASANASGNVRPPCSPAKHDRNHRASCTPLACSTRQPRCSGVSIHVFSSRPRVLSYLSTAQAPRRVVRQTARVAAVGLDSRSFQAPAGQSAVALSSVRGSSLIRVAFPGWLPLKGWRAYCCGRSVSSPCRRRQSCDGRSAHRRQDSGRQSASALRVAKRSILPNYRFSVRLSDRRRHATALSVRR